MYTLYSVHSTRAIDSGSFPSGWFIDGLAWLRNFLSFLFLFHHFFFFFWEGGLVGSAITRHHKSYVLQYYCLFNSIIVCCLLNLLNVEFTWCWIYFMLILNLDMNVCFTCCIACCIAWISEFVYYVGWIYDIRICSTVSFPLFEEWWRRNCGAFSRDKVE